MRPDLIIFDCDGVLVNTEAVANQVMSTVLRRFGFDITAEQCRLRFVGRSAEDIQAEVETESGFLLGPTWPALLRAETERSFDHGVEPVRGVQPAMEQILKVGVKYCVASSGRLSKMRKSLAWQGCSNTLSMSYSAPNKWGVESLRPTSSYLPPNVWVSRRANAL
jgi:beta-phosphoglucomutase-like phosphatase (HAD superfamily)